MAKQIINIGTNPNDGTGDQLRTAFDKVNSNTEELYQSGPVGSNLKLELNTLSSINTNGDIILLPDGIGKIQLENNVVALGDVEISGILNTDSLNVNAGTVMKDLTIDGSLGAEFILNDGATTMASIDASSGNMYTAGS